MQLELASHVCTSHLEIAPLSFPGGHNNSQVLKKIKETVEYHVHMNSKLIECLKQIIQNIY